MRTATQKALFVLYGVLLLCLVLWSGIHPSRIWVAPLVLLFFFFAYEFDVRIPSMGSMNLDHIIAFPSVVLLDHPLTAGLLAGVALLGTRLRRKGLGGLTLINAFDTMQVAVSISLGGFLYLWTAGRFGGGTPAALGGLLAAMLVTSAVNLGSVTLMRIAGRDPIPAASMRQYLRQIVFWIFISFPFLVLLVNAVQAGQHLEVTLSALAILILIWALRLTVGLQQKHAAIFQAHRRQEFLQQLMLTSEQSLASETFLKDLLAGLKEFIEWDRELLFLPPSEEAGMTRCMSLGDLPADVDGLAEQLHALLGDPDLREPRLTVGNEMEGLLSPQTTSQVVTALATQEIAFGILVLERSGSRDPFAQEDIKFLELALGQIAQNVQDEILKRQLLKTNRKLMQQTDFLSEILKISNLLKVHLDVNGILDRVAKGIRENMGFRYVLISLLREEEGCFERVAQAGLDDIWEEIQQAKPPAKEILDLLDEKFRVSGSYYISHKENRILSHAVVTHAGKPVREADDWDPKDVLIVPLVDKDEDLLGIISLDEPVDGKIPSMETLRAMEILANQTVHALESAQVHLQIRRQAVLDGLTGLHNHRYFQETLVAQASREDQAGTYAILMMDLDNFKEINDTYGHLVGDTVLKAVADALRGSIRKGDVAARYGGEEFAVFLPRQDREQARHVAERVRRVVEEMNLALDGVQEPIRVTLSVGYAAYPEDGSDHQTILERADEALYLAKRAGKNRVFAVSS